MTPVDKEAFSGRRLTVTLPLIDEGMVKSMVKKHEVSSSRMVVETEYSHFEMKFLNRGSLPDLLSLQNVVAADLPSPEIFMLHDDMYFREALRFERSVIGVTEEKELIAYSIIRIPGRSNDNLGRDINLREEELAKVAHLQAVAVHPAYRGNGLQQKLTSAHLGVIEEMGFEHICCTVSPKNPVSLANMLSCGFVIEALTVKMQAWWRYILHKDILRPGPIYGEEPESEFWGTATLIQISDIEGQLDLLKRGFKGFKVELLPEGAEVFYAML
jgi:GNAT superfamily N-acetyltransferase